MTSHTHHSSHFWQFLFRTFNQVCFANPPPLISCGLIVIRTISTGWFLYTMTDNQLYIDVVQSLRVVVGGDGGGVLPVRGGGHFPAFIWIDITLYDQPVSVHTHQKWNTSPPHTVAHTWRQNIILHYFNINLMVIVQCAMYCSTWQWHYNTRTKL